MSLGNANISQQHELYWSHQAKYGCVVCFRVDQRCVFLMNYTLCLEQEGQNQFQTTVWKCSVFSLNDSWIMLDCKLRIYLNNANVWHHWPLPIDLSKFWYQTHNCDYRSSAEWISPQLTTLLNTRTECSPSPHNYIYRANQLIYGTHSWVLLQPRCCFSRVNIA